MKSILTLAIALLSLSTQTSLAQNDVIVSDFKVVANCQEADYAFVLPDTVPVSIVTQGKSYNPRCLKIKKGTAVHIQASARHPLQGIQDTSPGAPANPIYDERGSSESSKHVVFNELGVFGFYCEAHGDRDGSGMAGAIWVVE